MHTPVPRTLRQCTTEVTYPGGTEHIRAVRAGLRAILDDCPRADDAILCASELAANAAQHSRSRLSGGTFTVRAKSAKTITFGSKSKTTAVPGTRE